MRGTKDHSSARRRYARYLLAGVRLINGSIGLAKPEQFIKRFDPEREPSPAAIYAFRLFGIRTVLLALDLLVLRDAQLERALRQGVLIHLSDATTAILLGARGQVGMRIAVTTALISATNVLLALDAMEPRR